MTVVSAMTTVDEVGAALEGLGLLLDLEDEEETSGVGLEKIAVDDVLKMATVLAWSSLA